MAKSKTSTEVTAAYIKLTEYLIRQYGLSLCVFARATTPLPSRSKAIQTYPISYQADDLLTSEQAATILGLRAKTLANWRVQGIEKLPFRKIGGAVRYQHEDVRKFVEFNKKQNTSQR
ncbi:helix-turn-helix domain-containing protein [Brucella pseudogrignonensis]|uniref:helix-turn-helix domain-containing protein n=1 Tax=Brucella pseudogrignonensis TaxID=419475 RepID=UPI000CFBA8D5|nr:helix-turn-helix domain-containing protein [Brucella pseudogrignonensis]MQP40962.1 helix-turn-helix domain-containing protein [Ochrobactrum sp. MYb237]PQZ40915.1 hypothetical protein CQ059_16840 [Brucella pseudogrignonensis]PRA40366.1 hypothetical protein CQ063_12315 [Brucella pseudogrignonensis]PRA68959.1 hypothetical protein CQ055_12200 [Brucella pseudogrignonensis]